MAGTSFSQGVPQGTDRIYPDWLMPQAGVPEGISGSSKKASFLEDVQTMPELAARGVADAACGADEVDAAIIFSTLPFPWSRWELIWRFHQ